MTDYNKSVDDLNQGDKANASAHHVEQHLQALEDNQARELRYYSQEQEFSAAELATVINEARLNALLTQSDEFLDRLGNEIEGFEEE